MSLCGQYQDLILDGSLVILYISPEHVYPITVTPGKETTNFLDRFRHDDILGKPYGSKWTGVANKIVYGLHPSPELWSKVLLHRTQIIHVPDAAFIVSCLNIHSGSVVIESGTGSGSLSHHLIHALLPHGHLHTFEYNQHRADFAKAEFAKHGLSDHVTVYWRDIVKDGFADIESVDSICLDIPNPWTVITQAAQALKQNHGSICCFSPCIEQVQKTCAAMRHHGFVDIHMVEILVKEHLLKRLGPRENCTENRQVLFPRDNVRGHTGYLVFAQMESDLSH